MFLVFMLFMNYLFILLFRKGNPRCKKKPSPEMRTASNDCLPCKILLATAHCVS
jgi:hypothetical protein